MNDTVHPSWVSFTFKPLPASDRLFPDFESTRFRTGYSGIIASLKVELARLGVITAVIGADIDEQDIRVRDGLPKSNARFRSHSIALYFNHPKHGAIAFRCNRHENWQHNLYAIAKTLESLRAVDRYGCTHAAQHYSGFKALPPSDAEREAEFKTAEDAARWVFRKIGEPQNAESSSAIEILLNIRSGAWQDAYRSLAKSCHPDAGGSVEDWARVQLAKRLIQGVAA